MEIIEPNENQQFVGDDVDNPGRFLNNKSKSILDFGTY